MGACVYVRGSESVCMCGCVVYIASLVHYIKYAQEKLLQKQRHLQQRRNTFMNEWTECFMQVMWALQVMWAVQVMWAMNVVCCRLNRWCGLNRRCVVSYAGGVVWAIQLGGVV